MLQSIADIKYFPVTIFIRIEKAEIIVTHMQQNMNIPASRSRSRSLGHQGTISFGVNQISQNNALASTGPHFRDTDEL